ncbi:tetratricopeptide repeat protein [Streptomyces lasiicapitis]|uniref:tetratricopeptide repeat protein n=1 Tax=Streptomyces lasiicapitis TaxID=1923961 RepID=UPI00364E3168
MDGDWLPDDPDPSAGPRTAADLPPELGAFIRPDDASPAMLELYGPSDADTYALAVRLARLARDEPGSRARFQLCWVPVGTAGAAPDLALLRVLERLLDGRPSKAVYDMLLAEPGGLTETLIRECRLAPTEGPFLVVLDGEADVELLRVAARLVEGTRCRVLAMSEVRRSAAGVALAGYEVSGGRGTASPGLSKPATRLMHHLASWAGDEASAAVAAGLMPPRRRSMAAFRELRLRGLLRETRPGWYRLPLSHRRASSATTLDRNLLAAALGGLADLQEGADAYADLTVRLLRSGAPDGATLLDRLEPQLVGDQGLFRLLRMKQSLWQHTGGWEPLRTVAAVALRETGRPLPAAEALAAIDSPRATLHKAVAERCAGLLREASATLDGLPDEATPNGWVLHTRAALLCDMGVLRGAEKLLRSAVEAHQVRGDIRGEAWAMHHYGRLRLTRGDLEEAQKRLEAARDMFIGLGDRQGRAWTETELGRVQLLYGSYPEALHGLGRALALHRSNNDVRGTGWAKLYLALAHEGSGDPEQAAKRVRSAEWVLRAMPDHLGVAWAQHYRALLPFPDRVDLPNAMASLHSAMDHFRRAGCLHGLAWNTLELADLCRRETWGPAAVAGGLYGDAQRQFEEIGDLWGLRWAQSLRTTLTDPGRPADRARLVPLTARHLITEPGVEFTDGPLFPGTRSRVHLTLHDDRSTTGTASRIALHITPGPDHPWSTPATDLPWLTARATPLTAADVEPAHAVTLKPSPRDPDGAEFLFTPRRAGRHRLLFTIEHSATATVLQQVETYIDVTDGEHGAPDDALSPEALRRA